MKVKSVKPVGPVRGRSSSLVPGQLVRGRVISKLQPGFFRVGAAGQIFVAESDLPLEKGQRLTARVEMGESKLLLRIFEDDGRAAAEVLPLPDPDEIRRILTGLGYPPDDLEVTEFQERLDRYRRYGVLPGAEPSDAWILAILWVRGIRSGADSFALLSYFLRQAAFRRNAQLPPEKLSDFIKMDDTTAEKTVSELPPDTVSNEVPKGELRGDEFIDERRREAINLLNRHQADSGLLRRFSDLGGSYYALTKSLDNRHLSRWTDNPTLPGVLLEMARSGGRVRGRLHRLKTQNMENLEPSESLIRTWTDLLESGENEVEGFDFNEISDVESLRFTFWRKWQRDQAQDLTA